MPKRIMPIILIAAGSVVAGGVGYLAGFSNSPVRESGLDADSRVIVSPGVKEAETSAAGGDSSSIDQVKDAVFLANGVGNIEDAVDNNTDSARQAFLEASERRNLNLRESEKMDEGGLSLEESSEPSDSDISDMVRRMEALEQAFALDSRRNRGRGGGESGEDISELKETVSNLYDIVGGLPSLDTLETKITAVDGAIEEMNATMEKMVELGERMEKLQGGGEADAKAMAEAEAEIKEGKKELAKLADDTKAVTESLASLTASLEQGSKVDGDQKVALGELGKRVGGMETSAEAIRLRVDATENLSRGDREKLGSLASQISVMDKNLRSTVEGYRKVYDNSARTEKRFLDIESFLGNIEARLGGVEANFGPAQ